MSDTFINIIRLRETEYMVDGGSRW